MDAQCGRARMWRKFTPSSSSYFKKFREKLKTFHKIVDLTKFSRKNGAKHSEKQEILSRWKKKFVKSTI